MQRLRINFSRGEEIQFLSHLDLMRLWERILRRAELTLAYSEGFHPRPRLSLAAPLSVGVTSEAELMDVFLIHWTVPNVFISQVVRQLPRGLSIKDVWLVGLEVPSLQSQVSYAEYTSSIEVDNEIRDVDLSLQNLLSAKELPWHHYRDTGVRYYDLRTLVDDIWLISFSNSLCTIGMRLRCDSRGTGRPEQVTKALGFSKYPKFIHRTKLILN